MKEVAPEFKDRINALMKAIDDALLNYDEYNSDEKIDKWLQDMQGYRESILDEIGD